MHKTLPDWLESRIPNYEKAESIPQAFSDSTHQLWRLQGLNGDALDQKNHFLKVCNNTESPFWQVMQDLFDFDLRNEIANFSIIYEFIDKASSLKVPELIKAEALEHNNAYILTSEIEGSPIIQAGSTNSVVSDNNGQLVQQLANHLAALHSNTNSNWGSISKLQFSASDWSFRLEVILKKCTKRWGGAFLQSDKHLKQALKSLQLIQITKFVPLMPDLRWDQFLQKDDEITALVDLDAFVFAPYELDFVILEYILTADQIKVFVDEYSKHHTVPDINQVRLTYRLLLFYMQILGETDLDVWMNRESLF